MSPWLSFRPKAQKSSSKEKWLGYYLSLTSQVIVIGQIDGRTIRINYLLRMQLLFMTFFFFSSVKMTASYTISIAFLFMLSQTFTETLSQQCINGGSEKSISGWRLQNHVYKTLKANFGYECVLICRQDGRCQSFNWVISLNMCEFSDRTKEARPEDFVPDPDRYYYRRDMNRGEVYVS